MRHLFRLIVTVFCGAILCNAQATLAGAQEAPQPLRVVLLGTGLPRPSAARAGPADAIVVGKKTFIVDAGRGVVMRLVAASLPLDSIHCGFLPHLPSAQFA